MADFKPETDKCPVCDTTWTKTNFGAKTWYDCKPCRKTAEDIVVVKNKTSSGTKEYKLGSLDEWEAFIDMMNIDDDYDGTPFLKTMTKAQKFDICNELVKEGVIETSEEFWDFLQGV